MMTQYDDKQSEELLSASSHNELVPNRQDKMVAGAGSQRYLLSLLQPSI